MSDLRTLLEALPGALPDPGSGATPARFARLWEIAATDPSLGRLAEAHYDAVSILHEAGRAPALGATYGVWAAGGRDPATLSRDGDGVRLTGRKHWCSGATLVSHAVITARDRASNALVVVDMSEPGARPAPATWTSPAFEAVDTRTVDFDLRLDVDNVIGTDDWYLRRPGFWHGAVGVAACWAGCAAGLMGRLTSAWPGDPHSAAHLGAIDAGLWAMRSAIETAGREIDAHPTGDADEGRRRALRVRHVVDSTVADITTRVARAVGPGPLAHQPSVHVVLAETDLYRRQCHAERDLAELGGIVAGLSE